MRPSSPLWFKARQMMAIAVSGHFDHRPLISIRIPQASATRARIEPRLMQFLRAFVWRTALQAAGLVRQRHQGAVDRLEAAAQDVGRAGEADAQVALRVEVGAGDDHRAPLLDEPVDELERVDREAVPEEADAAGGRRDPVQLLRVRGGPRLEDRPALVQQVARALHELLATRERDLGE